MHQTQSEHLRKKGPGAIILGGSFHSLGAARNLAKHGVPVCILDTGSCVTRFSRAVSHFLECPSTDDESGFVEFLLRIAKERNVDGWVLFPSTDEYVRVLAQYQECLSKIYLFTIPSWEVVQCLYDKRLTHRLADKQGIPIPGTYHPLNIADLASISLEFPVVLKPAFSKHFLAATKKKAYRANNKEELISFYEKMARIIDPSEIMIQELIPGQADNLYSYVGFFKDGTPTAGMSARRLRQHPMEFGRASTYVEAVNLPELKKLATRLLTGIAFSGLAEVEFMYDHKDGRFELLEVNPRIWGWHTIAIRAGLDLPYMAYANAIGEEMPVVSAREGVKWVRLMTDIPTVLSEFLSKRLTLNQYLISMSGDMEYAVLSFSDPLPFLADLILGPYNYVSNSGF